MEVSKNGREEERRRTKTSPDLAVVLVQPQDLIEIFHGLGKLLFRSQDARDGV